MEQIYILRKFKKRRDELKTTIEQQLSKINIPTKSYKDIDEIDGSIIGIRIFIPSILDTSIAYSYDGVEKAIKCYLNFILHNKPKDDPLYDFSIVLLGSEDKSAFYDHCKYANFLKCPNVYYIINNIYDIKNYCNSHNEIKKFNIDDAIESLKQINIKPSSIYKDHHSIINEWSIYRWSKYIGLENINVEDKIESQLYYRYLKVINEIKEGDKKKFSIYENNGKVLLIDDEEGNGWGDFFRELFKQQNNNIQFESIGDGFNQNKTYQDIENIIKKELNDYNPDVVILDLRLLDCDFDEKDPHELTGAKILDKIKEFNKGIQVIVFSASNKIWNYQDLDYDGIIVKESPDQSVNSNYTKDCIKSLMDSITLGLLKASFVKEIYSKLEELKTFISKNKEIDDFIKNKMINNINVAYDLLLIGLRNPQRDKILAKSKGKYEQLKNIYNQFEKYLSYSYLQLFLLLEDYVRCDNVFNGDTEIYVKGVNSSYLIAKKLDDNTFETAISFNKSKHGYDLQKGQNNVKYMNLNFKINTLMYFIYDSPSQIMNWIELDKWRNQIAHSKDKKESKSPKDKGEPEYSLYKDYIMLIDFLLYILNFKNQNPIQLSFALSD